MHTRMDIFEQKAEYSKEENHMHCHRMLTGTTYWSRANTK
uniref:Uncharacterized protein n=1 Tax=Arundo donax TaxID=35708 RepID=A0A0A9HML5_ARUDO